MKLSITVEQDEATAMVAKAFDLEFQGTIETEIPDFTMPEDDYSIGLIVGSSGSGKSTILQSRDTGRAEWDSNKAIVSHFDTQKKASRNFTLAG